VNEIILAFGLDAEEFSVSRILSGHIHQTYKLTGAPSYILQRVNKNVFSKPLDIACNLRLASNHLKANHPQYLFLSSIPTKNGDELYFDHEGYPWRLYNFIENSTTIDQVASEREALNAASAFGRLTRYLEGVDVDQFAPTIERFHDLSWRYEQFETALHHSQKDRREKAADSIVLCHRYKVLVDQYVDLIQSKKMLPRIMHNDTKINNVLLDERTREAICVIDLDTLMPGYFIYDVGDMIRTFVCPVNEEEKDLASIVFRKDIYDAIRNGYQSQMGDILSRDELGLFPFAGKMMTYIMALRMLADYLNGDVYYHTTYPEQNHVRAKNQLKLLEVISAAI
jgi:Ser/Thr protein kinase RdoA (MazF antagonist)